MRLSPLWLVLGAVAAAYVGVGQAGFVWDDHALVELNGALKDPTWHKLFGQDLWCCGGEVRSAYYRPVMALSLLGDHLLWGDVAGGFHVTSLLVHLVAVGLLYGLARQTLPAGRAAVASLIFGLHPIQSEAVAWIAARNDLLAAVGVFAALWLLARPTPARCGGAVLAGLFACLSKESAFLLPVLVLAWPLPAADRRGTGWRVAAAGVAVAGALLARAGADLMPPSSGAETRAESLADVVRGAATVAGWLTIPWPLTSTATFLRPAAPATAWVGAVLTIALLGWLLRRGQARPLLFAACAFLPALAGIARYGTLGERYLYLPLAGVGVAVATAVPWSRAAAVVVGVLGVAALGALYVRLPDWHDDVTLFGAARLRAPDGFVEGQLGGALLRVGATGPALTMFDASLSRERRTLYGCLFVGDLASRHVEPAARPAALDRWAAAGCTGVPGFVDAAALSLFDGGQWEALRRYGGAPDHPGPPGVLDGSHRYQLALGAVRLADGDLLGAAALGLRYPTGEGAFHEQLLALLAPR